MSLALVRSRGLAGIDAPPVMVEVHLANGLPAFTIVGLPDAGVRESRDRVRAAILNSRFEFPARRITVNLAPADLPKESGRFDLPIALGILAASGQLPADALHGYEFAGELSLTGDLRPVRGALAMTLAMRRAAEERSFILPADNAAEAALVTGIEVRPARTLLAVCAHLSATARAAPEDRLPIATPCPAAVAASLPDMSDVRGQAPARRAMEVAAAGQHSVLLVGPPGSGKSMLAQRFPALLPPMEEHEALEAAAIKSLGAGGFDPASWRVRPFRAPHHTASGVALVGGGNVPRPGEISLAHHGVLFLDELPEFDRHALEVLREPIESGRITISRAARQAEFPARFQLVAAMNPCPCGYLGHAMRPCACTPDQVRRYQNRISGPLLDRIDVQIEVPAQRHDDLLDGPPGESTASMAARIAAARHLQQTRQGCANADLQGAALTRHCPLEPEAETMLRQAMARLGWSARAYYRILKLGRTIADLADSPTIHVQHAAEAIQYRRALGSASG